MKTKDNINTNNIKNGKKEIIKSNKKMLKT